MTGDRPPRPDTLPFDPDPVPELLRERDQWVAWRHEFDDGRDEWTKIPVDVDTAGFASSTDPDTWASFGAAVAYHDRDDTDTDGVGFVVHDEDLVAGVDLDDCRDPDTGDLEPWAVELLEVVPTYAEVSPSGTGLRLFGLGFIPDGGNRGDIDGTDGHLEMYDTGRYLTVTGHDIADAPDEVRQVNNAIVDVHAEYIADDPESAPNGSEDPETSGSNPGGDAGESVPFDDTELVDRAQAAENGKKFERLWNGSTRGYESHSEADLALCGLLAFWTGGDRDRMDRLFRRSGLMRDKWDDDRGDRTYGERTIDKALKGRTEYYDPDTGTGSTPPAEAVASHLIDAVLAAPEQWIDPDAQEWTVRATEDHSADEITAALQEGELPGEADAALADAVLAGDVPDDVAEALKAWRQAPNEWAIDVSRTIAADALEPAAIAYDAGVDVEDLGDLPARVRAHHVWERVMRRDDLYVIARMGERADGALFSFDASAGVWRETGADDLRAAGNDALGVAYSKRVGSELEERVRVTRTPGDPFGQVHVDEFGAPADTVPVSNGVLDLTERELKPLKPTDYALATLPVAYEPDAECPRFREFLGEVCHRPVDRKKIQEYVGYTLLHWALPYHKALFIAGPQASGKSTFLDIVHALLGDETTCSLAPQEFTSERFAGYDLWRAWANIRSDIPSDLIENTGKFKEVIAGDPVKVEQKYADPITIEPTAKHLFAANTLPSAEIDDDAFFRRILLVSFPRTVPRNERDPHLDEKLVDELPGILNWALDGLERLREQRHFSGDLPPGATQEKWASWGESVKRFKQRCLETEPGAFVSKSRAYDAYAQFCEAEGIPVETRQKFGRELMNDSNVGEAQRTIDGSRTWVYAGVHLLEDRLPSPEADDVDQDGLDGY